MAAGGAGPAARFAGRSLFCTGGTSGIGEAVCRRFAADGGRVAVVGRSEERAARIASELPGAIGIAADVADEREMAAAVARAGETFGGLDGVYNGAGNVAVGGIDSVSVADFRRMLEVHVLGTFIVCREALPFLRAAERPAIVNTSSVVALMARPGLSTYGATKGAIAAFTRQLALELAPQVRVNCVSPGRTVTGMTAPMYAALADGDLEAGKRIASEPVPLGRTAEPAEQAAAICFLLSDDASYITGADLVVDAGMTIA
jgi:NAD(P)-dependent dehydrogenase (short-subunit alcohol dehydrogenase family)